MTVLFVPSQMDTVMSLTNTAVKNAKPKDKPYKLTDGGGLYLLVNKAGAKYWRYDYRINRKRKTLAIGVYDQVSLKDARIQHREAKALVGQGIDPMEEKKQRLAEKAEEKRTGKTFKQVAIAWADFKSLPDTKRSWKPTHKKDVINSLEKEAFPAIGDKVISTITIDDIEAILNPITERGALEVAERLLGRIEATFRYGKVKRWCEHNPADGLREYMPKKKTKHMLFLKKDELPKFLSDLDNYQGNFVCKSAVEFVLLTHIRTKEIRGLEWSFVDFNEKLLNIPAEVMKMGISQTIPLSNQAIHVLKSLQPITGSSTYIFASLTQMKKSISENGMLSVIYRMGYKGKTTVHGLRSTFSTVANEELKFRPDTVEAALAHKVIDPVRAAYCHATYLEERAENIQKWADFLDEQRVGESNVVPLRVEL